MLLDSKKVGNLFYLECTSDRIWNYVELIKYLVRNQTQSIEIKVNPEAICLHSLGFYNILDCFEFQQVTIYTNNPLETHDKYNIVYQENLWWLNKVHPINQDLFTWNQNKLFFCLYGRPTAGRLGLSGYLNAHYPEKSLIHFSASKHDDTLKDFELDKLLSLRTDSINEIGAIIKQLPILLSSPERYTAFNGYDYSDPLTQFYKDILIDVVVESHVTGNTFYVTEKTVRPMLLKKPFIMYASKNYLDYLHQLGFKTFNNFWNETYDGFEKKDRFNQILLLIDDLVAKSPAELVAMYNDMTDVLDHNYNLLLSQNFKKTVTEIV